jgi:C1A family cysteine protease
MNTICHWTSFFGVYKCETPVSIQMQQEFLMHVTKYGLSYGTKDEYEFRRGLFIAKDAEIQEINSSQTSFTVGHNQFSTYTDFEYKKMLGYKAPSNMRIENEKYLDTTDLADEVNWITKGAVNPVKNQGQCGSCWAFSATCAIEGAHFITTGKLLDLSEQQFVDCDDRSFGCNGGW